MCVKSCWLSFLHINVHVCENVDNINDVENFDFFLLFKKYIFKFFNWSYLNNSQSLCFTLHCTQISL